MNKILFFLCIINLLIGCEKNSNDSEIDIKQILVGTWTLKKVVIKGEDSGVPFEFTSSNTSGYYKFYENWKGDTEFTVEIANDTFGIQTMTGFEYELLGKNDNPFMTIVYDGGSKDTWGIENITETSFTGVSDVSNFDLTQQIFYFFTK